MNGLNLKTVDLFCGCGGMSLGFMEAGYDVVAAVDYWKPAVETYRTNLGASVFELGLDNEDVAVSFVRGISPDVVIGGPPCQDFSIAGNRDETAGRASLTLSFAAAVVACHPRCFVMENVPTALKSNTYSTAFEMLHDAGYGITAKVLDASRCGVPQARKRCFSIGVLGQDDGFLDAELEKHLSEKQMTVRDYMGDALDVEHYFCMPRSYKRRGIFSVDEPAATVRGMNRPVPATYNRHPGDTADPATVRALTEEERGWLQTFPKWFKWQGSKADVNQMIGNAVPVNLARYVAGVLRLYLDRMEMAEMVASAFESDADKSRWLA